MGSSFKIRLRASGAALDTCILQTGMLGDARDQTGPNGVTGSPILIGLHSGGAERSAASRFLFLLPIFFALLPRGAALRNVIRRLARNAIIVEKLSYVIIPANDPRLHRS